MKLRNKTDQEISTLIMDFSLQVIPRAPCGCLAMTAALGGDREEGWESQGTQQFSFSFTMHHSC